MGDLTANESQALWCKGLVESLPSDINSEKNKTELCLDALSINKTVRANWILSANAECSPHHCPYFPLFLKKTIWMKPFDSEISPHCLRVREDLGHLAFTGQERQHSWEKCLTVSRLIMCDIQKLKADATFIQLRIAGVTIIYHFFDIYTLPSNYFPVMAGANLSFSIWPERC